MCTIPFFMFDPDSLRFLYINQGEVKQVGYSLEELLHMTPLALKPDYTESQFRELLAPLLNSSMDAQTLISRHRRKDGSFVPVKFFSNISSRREKSRFVAFVRDITRGSTRQKRTCRPGLAVNRNWPPLGSWLPGSVMKSIHPRNTLAAISTSWAMLSRMSMRSSPAANNCWNHRPMLFLQKKTLPAKWMNTKNQADWDYLVEEIPRAINQSREGIAKISSIVLAMKEFSHPGCKEKRTDLNKLMETTVTIAGNEWKFVAEIDKQLDDSLPQVLCMPGEIGQVFLNILVNAAHAIKDTVGADTEKVQGRITIGSRLSDDNTAEITIADTGCGIPQTIGDKVYDPFFTTKEVGQGTGQGLAIAYDIVVNKHRGSLEFVSIEGKGTTFIIRLPVGNTAQQITTAKE